jgi:Uma2 family endonuclease
MAHTQAMDEVHAAKFGPHTWDEFVDLPDDDRRELIDGELAETEMPNEPHEYIVLALGYFLFGWTRANGGRAFASGYKVRIAERRGVMPDLQLFRRDNPRRSENLKGVRVGRPDLVVEIISPSSPKYDRVIKVGYYASAGVPEYWIIDPEAGTLERLVLRDGTYAIAESLADDALFRPDSFAGLEVPLGELWLAPNSA